MNEKIDRIERKLDEVLEHLAVLRAHDAAMHSEISEIRYRLWPSEKPVKRLYVALDDLNEAIAGLVNTSKP